MDTISTLLSNCWSSVPLEKHYISKCKSEAILEDTSSTRDLSSDHVPDVLVDEREPII
jgi:hypothetical protein